MAEIVRLKAQDYGELVDFCNMVYSMSSRPHHFPSLAPKLFQPSDEKMHAMLACKRDGRIKAVLGMYPLQLHAGSRELKVVGIGNVATHPDERNSGLMSRLMAVVLDEMAAEQISLSVLGGQRQRYGYYGYEKGGTSLTFSLTKSNLRHFYRNRSIAPVSFALQEPDQVDLGNLALLRRWHSQQPIYVARPADDFLTILASWYGRAWLARDPAGAAIGYLVSDQAGDTVSEIIAANPEDLLSIAGSWVRQQDKASVNFILAPWQQDAIADLGRIAEGCQVQPAGSFRINDWPLLLAALLEVKAKMQELPSGQLRLGIEDKGQVSVYELSLKDGQSSCRTCARNQADLVLDRLTATRLVLGPLPPALVIAHLNISSSLEKLLAAWLPLPLFWPSPDFV